MNTFSKTTVALFSGLLISMPAFLWADTVENQIIYVNLPKLMEESEMGKEKKGELEVFHGSKQKEIEQKVNTCKKAKADFEKAEKELSVKRKAFPEAASKDQEKVAELKLRVDELESRLQLALQNADNELKSEWMKATEQLYKELIEAIAEWAKEKNVYAVVDRESGRVLYCRETTDLTNDVVKMVNKKHVQKTTLAKAATPALKAPTTKVA